VNSSNLGERLIIPGIVWLLVALMSGAFMYSRGGATNMTYNVPIAPHNPNGPVSNGLFHLADAPGLGFDRNEEELSRHPGVRAQRPGFYV
jgi:hypothetical protein